MVRSRTTEKKQTCSESPFQHLVNWMKKKRPCTYQRIIEEKPLSTHEERNKIFLFIKKVNETYPRLVKEKENYIDWREMTLQLEQLSFYRKFYCSQRQELQEKLRALSSKCCGISHNACFILTSLERSSSLMEHEDYLDAIKNIYFEDPRLLLKQSSLLSRIRNSYFPAEYQLDESEYVENYFQTHLAPLLQEESTEDIPDVKEEILVDWIPGIREIGDLLQYGPVDSEKKTVRVALTAMTNLPRGLYHALVSHMLDKSTDSVYRKWKLLFTVFLLHSSSHGKTLEYDLIFQIIVSGFGYCLSIASGDGSDIVQVLRQLLQSSIFMALIKAGKPITDSLSVVNKLLCSVKSSFTF